jgi:hypothetical protein
MKNVKSCDTLSNLGMAVMACAACGSANETKVGAEVNLHFPGPMRLSEPGFFLSPKLALCLDCGFTEFTLPDPELCRLKKVLASRQTHTGNYTDAA